MTMQTYERTCFICKATSMVWGEPAPGEIYLCSGYCYASFNRRLGDIVRENDETHTSILMRLTDLESKTKALEEKLTAPFATPTVAMRVCRGCKVAIDEIKAGASVIVSICDNCNGGFSKPT